MSYYTVGFGGHSVSKTIKNLMLAVLGFYLLKHIAGEQSFSQLLELGALFPEKVLNKGMIWQPFTYMFLHISIWDVLINILVLWMFGTEVEAVLGERKFLIYYLTCGVVAAIAHMFFVYGSSMPMIGSAGCIFGVLIAFGALFPDRVITLLLFFVLPVTVKAKYMVAAFVGLEFFMLLDGSHVQIREFAPLFGLVAGYIFLLKGGYVTIGFLNRLRKRKYQVSDKNNIIKADFTYQDANNSYNEAAKLVKKINQKIKKQNMKIENKENKEMNRDAFISEEIDPILDKISKEGIHSLSEEEKMKLDKAKHLIK